MMPAWTLLASAKADVITNSLSLVRRTQASVARQAEEISPHTATGMVVGAAGYMQIPAGTSNNLCSFGVDFSDGQTRCRFVMSPPAYPGTGWATATCNSADPGGACNSWAIVPNMRAANPTVAKLYKIVNGAPVFIGAYRNTYFISITRPYVDGFSR